jgi:hypothetical protein
MIKKFFINLLLKYILSKGAVRKSMDNIKGFLQGKKTYIVATGAIIGVIVGWISGSLSDTEAIKSIVESLLAMTIRNGIK